MRQLMMRLNEGPEGSSRESTCPTSEDRGDCLRTNYVLIDYENVQPDALSPLDADHFKVKVFVGAGQSKVAFETASALQRLGDRAEYVKISGNGANALDLHIAYYIGRIAAEDPTASFHIVSKDSGFDPLIQHLRSQNILASRFKDVASIELSRDGNRKPMEEKLAIVVAKLQQRRASRPSSVKTLKGTINAWFRKQLSDEELVALVKGLEQEGLIVIDKANVTYTLPASAVES
jgi:PIN domain